MADDTKVDFYFYYHFNHLGSTNFVTRVAKSEDEASPRHEMYEHVEYIPFGETWIEEREVLPFGGSKSNRYLFTSKEFDQETRLYYYGARYYDPKTSIWLSADPILGDYLDGKPNKGVFNSSNLNLYAYTFQNPVKLIDPNGENPDGDNYDDGYEDVDIGKIQSDLKKGGKWLWNNIFKPVLSALDDENEDEDGFTNLEKTILFRGKGFKPSKGVNKEGKLASVGKASLRTFSKIASYKGNLPKKLWKARDYKQMKYMTKQLGEYLKKNPKERLKYTKEQLKAIEKGKARIPGYTWHHGKKPGRMELVPRELHKKSGHKGGRSIWGGGSKRR